MKEQEKNNMQKCSAPMAFPADVWHFPLSSPPVILPDTHFSQLTPFLPHDA
jgi:hypothetical protein